MDYNKLLNEIREHQYDEDDRKKAEIYKWKMMPAYETANRIESLQLYYKKQKLTAQAKLVLRVCIPAAYEFKFGWSCYLEVYCGGEMLSKEYASSEYCESIFKDKSWEAENFQGGLSFFSQNLENTIKVKKSKKKKEVNNV